MVNIVTEHESSSLDSLLEKVYRDSGYDFRDYRRRTVDRRLARRLHTVGARNYQEYMNYLDAHHEEYREMADDITIKVSGFFRNPYSFRQVAMSVLPELLAGKMARGEREIRFWSAACARGEEPYSIAIMLAEFLREQRQDINVRVYATDISRRALDEAMAGEYSPFDVDGLSSTMLQEYFIPHGQQYQVKDDIRQTVSFSRFDLTLTDQAFFSDIDCVYCCNVLIYLQRQLQERVLNMLYDSLAVPGYLVLGEVETPVPSLREKLECVDSMARIDKKTD